MDPVTILIQKELEEIEQKKNFVVLFAIENGSRAWGLESADSDYDIRFVYAYPFTEYLKITKRSIQRTINWFNQEKKPSFDFVGWDIRKFLQLLAKSNPTALEWLRTPIEYAGSRELFDPLKNIFQLKDLFYHYTSIAKSNYQRFIKECKQDEVSTKKYLYVLRGVLNAFVIYETHDYPPFNFQDTCSFINKQFPSFLPDGLVEKIYTLINHKRTTEQELISRVTQLDSFIEQWFKEAKQKGLELEKENKEYPKEALNEILFKILNLK